MKKSIKFLSAIFAGALLLGGCNNQEAPQEEPEEQHEEEQDRSPAITSISIVGGDKTISLGNSFNLTSEIVAINGASDVVMWSSSATDIVSLTSTKGKTITAKALKVGTAKITLTSVFDQTKTDEVTITVEKNWSKDILDMMISHLGTTVPYFDGSYTWSDSSFNYDYKIVATSKKGSDYDYAFNTFRALNLEEHYDEETAKYEFRKDLTDVFGEYYYLQLELYKTGTFKTPVIKATVGYRFHEVPEWPAEEIANSIKFMDDIYIETVPAADGTQFYYGAGVFEDSSVLTIVGSIDSYFDKLESEGWLFWLYSEINNVYQYYSPLFTVVVGIQPADTESFNVKIVPVYSMPITPTTEFPASSLDRLLADYVPFEEIDQIPSAEGDKFYLQILPTPGSFNLTVFGNTQTYLEKVANSDWSFDPSYAQFATEEFPQFRYISPHDTARIVINAYSTNCFGILIETYSSKPTTVTSWPNEEVTECLALSDFPLDDVIPADGTSFMYCPSLLYNNMCYVAVEGSLDAYKAKLKEAGYFEFRDKTGKFCMLSPELTYSIYFDMVADNSFRINFRVTSEKVTATTTFPTEQLKALIQGHTSVALPEIEEFERVYLRTVAGIEVIAVNSSMTDYLQILENDGFIISDGEQSFVKIATKDNLVVTIRDCFENFKLDITFK